MTESPTRHRGTAQYSSEILPEAPPLNAIRLESFKMPEGLDDALTVESVQGKEQQEVRPPLCSVPE
jgi:hypothetical protein